MDYSASDKEDRMFWEKIRSGEKKFLENLFTKYYVRLCRHALKFVGRRDISEEIVQELFIDLWKKREDIQDIHSLGAYLFTSVKNRSLNYLKSGQARYELRDEMYFESPLHTVEEYMDASELERIVAAAIDRLPEKCRNIFILNRHEGLTYKMIAEKLNISHKTVETQMALAIHKVKEQVESRWGKLLALIVLALLYFTVFITR